MQLEAAPTLIQHPQDKLDRGRLYRWGGLFTASRVASILVGGSKAISGVGTKSAGQPLCVLPEPFRTYCLWRWV